MEDSILVLFRSRDLTRISDQVVGLLRHAISIKTQPIDNKADIPVGASKFGGLPDLPSLLRWPEWQERPLPFLAQIRLSDIAPLDYANELPHSGMLYFFFDEEALETYPPTRESWHVIYANSNFAYPQHLPVSSEELRIYPTCSLEFSNRLTLPPFESRYLENLGLSYNAFERNAPPEQRKEADAYIELEQQLEAFYENETLHHQLLGHPFQIQGDLLWECQQDTGYAGDPTDWRLLLQIDTDDDAGVMWGDVGILYFYIPQQALAARDFSQVHLIMQCS
jgi:uncharacterized protein YwqG